MTIINQKLRAIFFAVLSALLVATVASIIYLQKNNFSEKSAPKFSFKEIVYLVEAKNFAEIYAYNLADQKTRLLYTDTDEGYKLNNIVAFDPIGLFLLVQEARPGYQSERLTQINLSNAEKHVLKENFPFILASGDINATNLCYLLNGENLQQLMVGTQAKTLQLMTKWEEVPTSLECHYPSNHIISAFSEGNIELWYDDWLTIDESKGSIFSFDPKTTTLYFNRGSQIFTYNTQNKRILQYAQLEYEPLSLLIEGDTTIYLYHSSDSDTNAMLVNNQTQELPFQANKIIGVIR